jgi:hypothetical protein
MKFIAAAECLCKAADGLSAPPAEIPVTSLVPTIADVRPKPNLATIGIRKSCWCFKS